MKNLKKLSVVLMITTLFSASFTSCIDNEVSPVVEAIYEAQADLIAAQSTVQNAQAALLLAQADAEQAQATLLLAQAEAAADIAAGQLAGLLADAGLTDAQAALVMAQATSLADLTAAQVAGLIAEAGLTDAQAAMIMAQATALADKTAAEVIQIIADAGLTDAQAALVMAEAAALADMTAAEVAALLADAGYTDAQTARIMAEIARYEQETENLRLQQEQELLLLVAKTNRKVQEEVALLALAEAQFDHDMETLMLSLEAADAALAAEYAGKYTWAMQNVNNLQLTKLNKESWVATQELLLANSALSLQSTIAAFQQTIDVKTAEIATKQAAIADYQAIIDDPASLESRVTELKAEALALKAENEALEIEIVEVQNMIADKYAEYDALDDMEIEYETKYDFLMDRMDEKQDLVDENAGWQARIDEIQAALDTYAATTASLEAAVAAAEAAEAAADAAQIAAQGVLDTAKDDRDDAVQASDDADQDVVDAQNALTALENEIATLFARLQQEINDLAAEQALFDAGIGAATAAVATAGTNVANAQTALADAEAEYLFWQDQFENVAPMNGGYFWEDTTSPSMVLGDDILGEFNTTTTVDTAPNTAYVRVETWTYVDNGPAGSDPSDRYYPQTLGTVQQPTILGIVAGGAPPVDEIAILGDGAIGPAAYAVSHPAVNPERAYFVEVGLDDEGYMNQAEYNAAVAALGDDVIFDTPPAAGMTLLMGTDAYTVLYNAMIAELDAQDFLDNFGDDLDAAQAEYDYWKNLYDNELVLVDAAQLLVADMQALAATAAADEAAAEAAVVTARQARNDADAVLADAMVDTADAEAELADWLSTTEEQWQNRINNRLEWIAANDILIAELDIIIARAQEEVDELQAAYDASLAAPYRAALLVEIYDLYEMVWEKQATIDANLIQYNQNKAIAIAMFGSMNDVVTHEDLMEMIDDCNDEIATLEGEIVGLQADIAAAEATGEVDAANWQALIDLAIDTIGDLEVEIANYMTLADEYLALMNAALED